LEFVLGPTFRVVIAGELADKNTIEMIKALRKVYLPNSTVKLWVPKSVESASSNAVYEQIEGKTTAYLCRDKTCMPPTNNISKLIELLKN